MSKTDHHLLRQNFCQRNSVILENSHFNSLLYWRQQKQQCLFSLLRFYDKLFDVINNDPFLTLWKTPANVAIHIAYFDQFYLFFQLNLSLTSCAKFWISETLRSNVNPWPTRNVSSSPKKSNVWRSK